MNTALLFQIISISVQTPSMERCLSLLLDNALHYLVRIKQHQMIKLLLSSGEFGNCEILIIICKMGNTNNWSHQLLSKSDKQKTVI